MTLTAADYAEMKRRLAADVLSVDVLHVKGDVDLNSLRPRNAIILGSSPGAAGQFLASQGPGKIPTWGTGTGVAWPLTNTGDMGFRPNGIGSDLVEFSTTGSAIFANGAVIPGVPTIQTSDSGGIINFTVNDSNPGHVSGPTVAIANNGTSNSLEVADGSGGAQLLVGPLTSGTVGFVIGEALAAPASSDLANSQVALWLDPTPGATKLNIKAKDSGGTVRTASINLT